MNGLVLFIGLLVATALSWYGIVAKNFIDFNRLQPQKLDVGGAYPAGRAGQANYGQEVYKANGCFSCHTMQVRMNGYGADIERHWGKRNSTLQDFLYDQNVFLGQVRVGPDLADVGTRLPNRENQLLHLYNPRITVPDSLMPRYAYLFKKRKIQGQPSSHALKFPSGFAPEAGYEIVPTPEAEALVSYLLSLHAQEPILEAPIYPPPAKTNAVEETTTNNLSAAAPQQ